MTCGIYKLTFPSGNFYIGKSINIEKRWEQHYSSLTKGTHTKNLQTEFNIYSSYTEEVMLEVHEDHCDIVEETYIAWYQPPLNGTKGRDRIGPLEDVNHLTILMGYFSMSTLEHLVELHNGKNKIAELIESLGNKTCALEEMEMEYDGSLLDLKESDALIVKLKEELEVSRGKIHKLGHDIVDKDARTVELYSSIDYLSKQRSAEEVEKDTLGRILGMGNILGATREHASTLAAEITVLNVELNALDTECNELWEYKRLPWYKKIFV